jgi:ABC-type transporter Mla subunit MlaD
MAGSGLYLRIGLLIIGGTALLVALIWFLGGAQLSHGILFESYFSESVQGLEVGAAVKYRGVTLGRVTDIGLVSAEYAQYESLNPASTTYQLVFVRGIVDADKIGRAPNPDEAVAEGLRSRLAIQGLTGLSYLELDFVNPKDNPPLPVPWTPKVTYVPSIQSTLARVQDAAQQFLTKLSRVDLDKLADQTTGLITDLRSSLVSGDAHQTLAQAQSTLRAAQDAIQAADVPAFSTDLRRTATSLRDLVQSPETQKLLASATLAAERLANAADRLPALIASLQTTSRRADNGVADLEQSLIPVIRDIQTAATNLRELTTALRRSPAQAFFGNPPPRTGPGR